MLLRSRFAITAPNMVAVYTLNFSLDVLGPILTWLDH